MLSDVSLRHLAPRVDDALTPGGCVVIEGFHREATRTNPHRWRPVTRFSKLGILRYEDVQSIGDFGLRETRVVRLHAQKH